MTKKETQKETRKWLKEHHLCKECYSKDAYTLSGRTLCAECAAKAAERKRFAKAKNAEYKQRQIEAVKKWRKEKAESGLCSRCGKRKTDGIHKTCDYCRYKMKQRRREERAKVATTNYPRGENGYCWQCNKNMALPGYRLCQECYSKKIIVSMVNLKLANANNPYRAID